MNQSNLLTVRVAGVMNRQAVVLHAGRTLPCLLSGRLLRQKDSLAVGDRAEAEVLGGGQYRLTRILPRTSALRRLSRRGSGDALLAANADFVLAVCAAPSLLRAFALPEWALEAARAAGLPAGLFVSHWDRLAPEEGDALARRLEPLRAELDSLAWGSALEPPAGLLPALRGKSVAVLGGPGCGKTALIQRLAGVQAPLRPTTAVSLSQGPDGTLWLDTPGFRGASPAAKPAPDYRRQPCGESFSCKACGALVTPEGAASRHRNHCPHCLSSLHVDEEPGDRACTCRGIMEPVGVWVRKGGEWALIHRCRACGALRSNRIAADDNPALLLSIALRPLAQPPFPLSSLSGVDLSREMRHNEGNDRQEADA